MLKTSQLPAGSRIRLGLGILALLVAIPISTARPQEHGSTAAPIIREIRVSGNERTRAWIILREMEAQVGQRYDAERARRDRDRVDNLDLFSEVAIDTALWNHSVTLEVKVKERLVWIPIEWIPYPVLNWNEENGWSYGMGLTNPNSSGKNRSFSLLVEGGGRRQARFSYSDPWVVGNHGSAAISLTTSESQDMEGQTNRWTAVGIALGSYLGNWGRARLIVNTAKIETDPWRTASGTQQDRLRSAGFQLAWDTRDVYADPRSGAYVGGYVTLNRPVLQGTVDYTSYRLDLRRYQTVWPSHAIATRISMLFRDSPVPDYRRVRLGGVTGVRGIHPLSFKGRNRLLASVEYRVAVKEKRSYDVWFVRNIDLGLMITLFADAGSVWNGDSLPDRDQMYGSFGVGIRILSQQTARLEVAYSRRDGTQWIVATGMPF